MLESFDALEHLESFVSTSGRAFYKRESLSGEKVLLQKVDGGRLIEDSWNEGEQEVVPFWSGKKINWVIADQ